MFPLSDSNSLSSSPFSYVNYDYNRIKELFSQEVLFSKEKMSSMPPREALADKRDDFRRKKIIIIAWWQKLLWL